MYYKYRYGGTRSRLQIYGVCVRIGVGASMCSLGVYTSSEHMLAPTPIRPQAPYICKRDLVPPYLVVKALRYKPAGRRFDFRLCHWNFSVTYSFRPHYGPGVDSAPDRNEYQVYFFLGVKLAGA